ncbi:hypothetical protein MUK42_17097 [Musa troglodytarum]|uniref:Uncharacterized protein n=1 Tax=Musa troglodytarum TaxID=320322 RepID=A0A9E7HIH0_9LILI|nr:hypothetical protein MUK42_17097 [Musa troglodytarum]
MTIFICVEWTVENKGVFCHNQLFHLLYKFLILSFSSALLHSYAYIEIPTDAYIKGIAKRNRDMFSLEDLLPLHISFTFSLSVILGRLLRILIVLFANTWSNFLVRHILLETEFLKKKMMFDL